MSEKKNIIKEYLASASGLWVKADSVRPGEKILIHDSVRPGEKILIQAVTLDDKSFDKPYIVVHGVNAAGDDVRVRLGVKNVARVVETLGDDESRWVGNYLEVLTTEMYPGVGARGILWRGVLASQSAGHSVARRLGEPDRRRPPRLSGGIQ